jgi:CRISPR-associated protein Csm3
MEMAKWTHLVEMKFRIKLLDPMRIGGSGGGLEIGGVDPNLMALKDPINNRPYIPGSSLKGKLRSTLEREHGLGSRGKPCECGRRDCPVCPLFGAHTHEARPCGAARLTVRDAGFTPEYLTFWESRIAAGAQLFEIKAESINDRDRGTAGHPRFQERVPAGAVFDACLVLKLFQASREGEKDDNEAKMVSDLKHALGVLEYDALGAGGSRGSGRVKIEHLSWDKIALASITL